jgi:pyruvate dehydrogenase E1 component alpha subunit
MSKDTLKDMLTKMMLTRKFEEKVAYFFSMGMVHGTTHLYVGEEASATGICCAMAPQDLMTSTHRGHGHCISKGMDIKIMMAELLGKETGYCKGKGGSMHIADLHIGNLGANGVVGGGHCLAVGAALTTAMKKIDRIVVCFFGDGAANEGSFHEALNLASIWKLPVLFVCENNQYGMSMSKKRSMNIDDIAVRASSYGIPGETIDGNDVLKVYEKMKQAREYVRDNGPMLLVCNTYRYLGHSKSDANVYRTKEEINEWKEKDPIKRLKEYLVSGKVMTQKEIDALETETTQIIEDAVTFAENSTYPSLDTIMDDVYA